MVENNQRLTPVGQCDDDVTFELRTMKQDVRLHAVDNSKSCIVCLICLVCSAFQAGEFGVPSLSSPVTT